MRALAVMAVCIGCGGGGPAKLAPGTTAPGAKPASAQDRVAVDPIAAIAPPGEAADVSWLQPGQAQLALDGPMLENPGGARPLPVTVIEDTGGHVRVAVRLPHARFALWTDRNRLFGVMRKTTRIGEVWGANSDDIHAEIRAGARVKRLAHKGQRTQIRYDGAVEIEGWVADDAVGDAGPPHEDRPRFSTGRALMVMPSSVIRSEPKWAATELAVMATGWQVDTISELEDGWVEVGYEDGDVSVHGFLSNRLPPGEVHRPRTEPPIQVVPLAPNAKVASGTCLYARASGEAIGYVVGDQQVALDDASPGWFTLSIETPWGPIAFAAQGASRTDLAACAPPDSVPPPATAP